MLKKIIWILIKLTITAGLLYYFFGKTDLNKVFESLKGIKIEFLLLLNLLNVGSVYVNAYKWKLLLREYELNKLFKLNMISYYFALLLPGQIAGEAAKTYILGKSNKTRVQKIAASVIIDKITGMIGLLIVGVIGLVFSAKELPIIILISFTSGVFILLFALFLIRIDYIYNLILKSIYYFESKVKKGFRIFNFIKELISAWHDYAKDLRIIIFNVLLGVLFQLIGAFTFYLLSRQFGVYINYGDWCWILGALTFAMLLPITIGGIGIREGTLVGLLGIYGVASETVLGISLISFSFLLVVALIGAVFYYFMKVPSFNSDSN